MQVYHVWQVVQPGARCSDAVGMNWLQAVDTEAQAVAIVERNMRHRFASDIGVTYAYTGPHDETEPVMAAEPQPCERCTEKPVMGRDEQTGQWDCVHWCYDRLSGAVNQPTMGAAVQAWNRLATQG